MRIGGSFDPLGKYLRYKKLYVERLTRFYIQTYAFVRFSSISAPKVRQKKKRTIDCKLIGIQAFLTLMVNLRVK